MIYIIGILLAILIFILPCVVATFSDYKYYLRIYKTLPYQRWYKNDNQIYNTPFGSDTGKFVWFIESGDFCLTDGHYLHNSFYTYLSPYSLYWFLKYRKWFNENVDIIKIEKY